MKYLIVALALMMSVHAALAADAVGLTNLNIPAAHHDRPVKTSGLLSRRGRHGNRDWR